MQNRKVLIADPSAEFCSSIARLLEPSMEVTVCTDGVSAKELLHALRPGVLVVDLILPKLDGLSVLKEAAAMLPRPALLVTLQFFSSYIEQSLRELAVDYAVMKPCNLPAVAGRVKELLIAPPKNILPSASELLLALGVPASSRGFRFLKTAVELYRSAPGLSMTKNLYPAVAQQHGVSSSAVEQAIRRAIQYAWSACHGEAWVRCFHSDLGQPVPKPSNAKFIATLAEHSLPDSNGK